MTRNESYLALLGNKAMDKAVFAVNRSHTNNINK